MATKKATEKTATGKDSETDAIDSESLEEAIAQLSPEQAEMFVTILEQTMKKRRLMLIGNLAAVVALVVGSLWAFYMFGNRDEGEFVGWVFLVPFAAAGAFLTIFGRLARRASPTIPTPPGSSEASP
jgi:hypothetical protein